MTTEIIFITPSLSAGGAERVMSMLANYASDKYTVHLISLTKQQKFYQINSNVRIHEPNFVIEDFSRWKYTVKNLFWLRKILREIKGHLVLSFSGKYNSFVILSSLGLGKSVFISDRSKPGISYGKFIDAVNPFLYRLSKGIIAQTSQAKAFSSKQTKHKNIMVIPNPVSIPEKIVEQNKREKLILNVGRFIKTKKQDLLLDLFCKIQTANSYDLIFLGDGRELENIKQKAEDLNCKRTFFKGNVRDVEEWYQKSQIFAFTSTSEGFPNALAEAMANGCACIAFDCTAGPKDIIDDGINGFLVPEGDDNMYREKLLMLMSDSKLREKFSKNARLKMNSFEFSVIANRYLDFILG